MIGTPGGASGARLKATVAPQKRKHDRRHHDWRDRAHDGLGEDPERSAQKERRKGDRRTSFHAFFQARMRPAFHRSNVATVNALLTSYKEKARLRGGRAFTCVDACACR